MSDEVKMVADRVITTVKTFVGNQVERVRTHIEGVRLELLDRMSNLQERYDGAWPALDVRIKSLEHAEKIPGPQGERGEQGEQGLPGEAGPIGPQGNVGERGAEGLPGEKGERGSAGPQGTTGQPGPRGERGEIGPAGVKGNDGLDAYELAVAQGFNGTIDEWLPTLKGETGQPGQRGDAGADGKSAYDLAVETGFTGTMVDFFLSLQGKDGRDAVDGKDGISGANGVDGLNGKDGKDGANGVSAYDIAVGRGYVGSEIDWVRSLEGKSGVNGRDGRDGRDGKDGEHGRDAIAIDVLSTLDAAKSYPRGTYAMFRGGMVMSIRTTDPIGENALESCGWAVCTNGIDTESEEELLEGRIVRRVTNYTNGTAFAREFVTNRVIYRGVWAPADFLRGDTVTWDGSSWHCEKPTNDKPGYGSEDWKLMVKEGRRGKDGGAAPSALTRPPVRTK